MKIHGYNSPKWSIGTIRFEWSSPSLCFDEQMSDDVAATRLGVREYYTLLITLPHQKKKKNLKKWEDAFRKGP